MRLDIIIQNIFHLLVIAAILELAISAVFSLKFFEGYKNKEIAEQLVISLNTVLYHIKNIYSKLGVNKRTQAIAKAKEINLI